MNVAIAIVGLLGAGFGVPPAQTLKTQVTPAHVVRLESELIPPKDTFAVEVKVDGREGEIASGNDVAYTSTRNVLVRLTWKQRRAPISVQIVSLAGRHNVTITFRPEAVE